MIIVDTNVLSEPTNSQPDANVVEWFRRQRFEDLYYTATNLAESLVGLEQMPNGKRKDSMVGLTQTLITTFFGSRILPFDEAAAIAYSSLAASVLKRGKTIGFGDGQIAAIAKVHRFAVATRDVEPFLDAGLAVINPWLAP